MRTTYWIVTVGVFSALLCSPMPATERTCSVQVNVRHVFGSAEIEFDRVLYRTTSGAPVSVSRLSYFISKVQLARKGGSRITLKDQYALVDARSGKTDFTLEGIPVGSYDRIEFQVGVGETANHSDPNVYPADHPLNPSVNDLHWGWKGGYVFLALEGRYRTKRGKLDGYSYHIGGDERLMRIVLPIDLNVRKDRSIDLELDVRKVFGSVYLLNILRIGNSTHSGKDGGIARKFQRNIERAFAISKRNRATLRPSETAGNERTAPVHGTPYKLELPKHLPRPSLPKDNPLSNEGVALGKALFFDKRLSRGESISCSSCHDPENAFSDSRAISPGVGGMRGKRNSMPLFNLVWSREFFWDGRARTLREQALQPIENPLEMNESIESVVGKLKRSREYPDLFESAFGSSKISRESIGLALEQFLISLVSHDSKFDRAVLGKAKLSEEEKRGFELFMTENDPRRRKFGADCFHCHGGSLFTNHRFMNNGLDLEFPDLGRSTVTNNEADRGKFKVPSLRNIAVTGPYMHDGRFDTLEEVIEHYDNGVRRAVTLDPNLAKHPRGGLGLSRADKRALVAFLRSLTDQRYVEDAASSVKSGR